MTHDLCGCCDIREKLKAMWERLQTTIYGIRVNGARQIPDGQGIIDLSIPDTSALESRLETAEQNIDGLDDDVEQIESEIATLQTGKQNKLTAGQNITIVNDVISAAGGEGGAIWGSITGDIDDQTDLKDIIDSVDGRLDDIDGTGGSIEQIEAEIGALQTSVEGHTTQIGDLETALEVAEGDIDELDQDVVRIDGQIDAINTAVTGQQTTIGNLQTAVAGKENTLNADQKRKITISTASPSGGNDGDIWLKYTA